MASITRPCPFGGVCVYKKFQTRDPFSGEVINEFRCQSCGHLAED